MIARLRPPLDVGDLDQQIVAALALADLSLEALVAAFFVQHPRLDEPPRRPAPGGSVPGPGMDQC
ncbi:MAG: hypothetical protein KF718_29070 [Polyangiaceae bacterium]|nr:hypothetical protein [Polyangiaceae bacterium]